MIIEIGDNLSITICAFLMFSFLMLAAWNKK